MSALASLYQMLCYKEKIKPILFTENLKIFNINTIWDPNGWVINFFYRRTCNPLIDFHTGSCIYWMIVSSYLFPGYPAISPAFGASASDRPVG
jgi:hypothetical protein